MRDKTSLLEASVAITLDGREWRLRYRALAFITYAETVKRDLLQDVGEIGKEFTAIGAHAAAAKAEGATAEMVPLNLAPAFIRIRDLLWAGMIDQHPEMTRDEVARLFGFTDINEIAHVIMGAIKLTLPESPANGGGPRPTKALKRASVSL